jgi:hypothetical protein
MYPPIFATAVRSPQVLSLLGTNPTRLYMFGMAPQGVQYPYAVWRTFSGAPENYLGDDPDIDSFGIQVDVYAESPDSARECAMALRNALQRSAHIVSWRGESRDPETDSWRSSFDLDWWTER